MIGIIILAGSIIATVLMGYDPEEHKRRLL